MKPIDQAVKIQFLSDLIYIMQQAMLFQAYYSSCANDDLSRSKLQGFVHNAILESSLSFIRKINEFFGCKKEIGSNSYIPGFGPEWILDKDDKILLDSRVMHISLLEAESGKHDWSGFLLRYLPKSCQMFKRFYGDLLTLHPEYLTDSLRSDFENCIRYLDTYLQCLPLNSGLMIEDDSYTKKIRS